MANTPSIVDGKLEVIFGGTEIKVNWPDRNYTYDLLTNYQTCKRCSNILDTNDWVQKLTENCGHCKRIYVFDRAFSMGIFYDDFDEADDDLSWQIYQLKKKQWWAQPIGYGLALTIIECYPRLLSSDILVPIPIHEKKLTERKFNQAKELALYTRIGLYNNDIVIPIEKNLLKCDKYFDLRGLSTPERYDIVEGSFSLSGNADYEEVLIIDDVLTTGATASECAKILKEGGTNKVNVLAAGRHKYVSKE
jgi:predicted amidophosphoribosyltransferase